MQEKILLEVRLSNPTHPKKVPWPSCLPLRSALEIARDKDKLKGKIFEMNKEKQGKTAKEKNGDNCIGIEQHQQQQQQQQSVDIVASNKSDLDHHLKFGNERGKIKDEIKGRGKNYENRSDSGAKEKEYDKNNGKEEKVNSKRKVGEKGKEKGRAKESTNEFIVHASDDVIKGSDRYTHGEKEKEKEKDKDKDRDRLSLAGAVLGRRAPATSGIASKPRLEQVFPALSYLFSLTIPLLYYPIFYFPFFSDCCLLRSLFSFSFSFSFFFSPCIYFNLLRLFNNFND